MILSQIVAMSKNRVIGINNQLPWNIPEDMKFFRTKTKGHILIMGRRTYDSLGKPLPDRFHIVISRQNNLDFSHPKVKVVSNVDEAIALAQKLQSLDSQWPEEVFIIGGGQICAESMSITDKLYLTLIDREYDGDSFYPEIPDIFKLTEKTDILSEPPLAFTTWERNKS